MQVFKYFFVGGASAFVDIGLFVLLSYIFQFHWLPASILSFICATATNYFLSIRYVFNSGNRHSKYIEILGVFVVSSIALLANQVILFICIELLGVNLIASKITSIFFVFFLNYFGRKKFVF